MPAGCGLDFEGISSPQSPAITERNYRTCNGVVGRHTQMIVQESAWGMTQVKRERESANDTHHAHSKTTGSRPGTSIDQKRVGVTTHFSQVH